MALELVNKRQAEICCTFGHYYKPTGTNWLSVGLESISTLLEKSPDPPDKKHATLSHPDKLISCKIGLPVNSF